MNPQKKELLVFADPASYPVFFHCAVGRDRTGSLAYLLLGLCGVSDDDLKREYELTWFSEEGGSNPSGFQTNFKNMDEALKLYYSQKNGKDGTTAESVRFFMTDRLGITEEQVNSIISNLTE